MVLSHAVQSIFSNEKRAFSSDLLMGPGDLGGDIFGQNGDIVILWNKVGTEGDVHRNRRNSVAFVELGMGAIISQGHIQERGRLHKCNNRKMNQTVSFFEPIPIMSDASAFLNIYIS